MKRLFKRLDRELLLLMVVYVVVSTVAVLKADSILLGIGIVAVCTVLGVLVGLVWRSR